MKLKSSRTVLNMLELLLEQLMRISYCWLKVSNKEVVFLSSVERTLLMLELSRLLSVVLPWKLLVMSQKKILISLS